MEIKGRPNAEDTNQSAKHKLFVEGDPNTEGTEDTEDFDVAVLQELLKKDDRTRAIEVLPMGSCDHVRSAAQALVSNHPTYYFLIDRDDYPAAAVERSWQNFPDRDSYNMLILRKRELENYFIDYHYLKQSRFLKPDINLEEIIRQSCNQRIFLEAANLTLYKLSRGLQQPLAIPHFKAADQFPNQESGLQTLKSLTQIPEKAAKVANLLTETSVTAIYNDFVQELTHNVTPLEFGSGSWLERMAGKEIFEVVASQAFRVLNQKGTIQQGKKRMKLIAKDLVRRLPLAEKPQDFQELVELLADRLQSA